MTCQNCGKIISYRDEFPLCDKCYEESERISLGIVGSRTFNTKSHFNYMKRFIDKLFNNGKGIKEIVSGGCKEGVDVFAEKYSNYIHLTPKIFYADWYAEGYYDNSAGAKRNEKIVKRSDVIIAFWDGESKGTKITIDFAIKYNKELKIKILPKDKNLLEYLI